MYIFFFVVSFSFFLSSLPFSLSFCSFSLDHSKNRLLIYTLLSTLSLYLFILKKLLDFSENGSIKFHDFSKIYIFLDHLATIPPQQSIARLNLITVIARVSNFLHGSSSSSRNRWNRILLPRVTPAVSISMYSKEHPSSHKLPTSRFRALVIRRLIIACII